VRVCEDRKLRKVFGQKMDEVMGGGSGVEKAE
jgi:hypothetical protein